ncbi:MAG: hypothetical protein PHD32_02710 [Eubacteriales bacterium]|nr:hypothetical protein [Eubacteriales bacterium]
MKLSHSRAALYLMECTLVLLVFSLFCSVLLQLYMKSHTLAQDARDLTGAVFTAQSVAEQIKAGDTEGLSCGQALSFDGGWQPCAPDEAAFTVQLALTWEDALFSGNILVFRVSDNRELLTLPFACYAPQGGAE